MRLTEGAEALAGLLHQQLGIDLNVVRAWIAHESAWGTKPIRPYNYLNAKGGSGWASFGSVGEAANYYVGLITRRREWYGPITASAGRSPSEQIAAIAASPWSADHYGGAGGPNLVRAYNKVVEVYRGAVRAVTSFLFPVAGGGRFTDDWGDPRSGGRTHKGTDIFAPKGTPVLAVVGGTITKAGAAGISGNRIWLRGDDGLAYFYAHLDSIAATVGQKVTAGMKIGTVGNTGNAHTSSPHLHFGIARSDSGAGWMNPYPVLTGAQGAPGGVTADPVSTAQPVGAFGDWVVDKAQTVVIAGSLAILAVALIVGGLWLVFKGPAKELAEVVPLPGKVG